MEEYSPAINAQHYTEDRETEIRIAEAQAAFALARLMHTDSIDAEIEAAKTRLGLSEAAGVAAQITADKAALDYWKGVKFDLYVIRHALNPGDE